MEKDRIIEKNNPQRSVLVLDIFFTCPLQEPFSIAAQFRTKLRQGYRSTTSSDTINNKDLRAKPCHSKEPTVL
jgi:hypothetical protein